MLSRLLVRRQAEWRELRIPRSPRRSGHRRCRVGFRPGTVHEPTLGPPASERTPCRPRSEQGERDPAVPAGSAVAPSRPDEECSRMCLYLPEVILTLEPTLESFRRRSRLTAPSGQNRLRRSSAAGTRTSAPDRTRIHSEAVDRLDPSRHPNSLPPRSRDEARANSSTARHLGSHIEEFLEGSASVHQAASLTRPQR